MSNNNSVIGFSKSFTKTFNGLMETIQSSLDVLNKANVNLSRYGEYGACNTTYNLRYITPSNISTFVSDIVKLVTSNSEVFNCNSISDLEIFMACTAKRFIDQNDCIPFEESASKFMSVTEIRSKNCRLDDLIQAWINQSAMNVQVYSNSEMHKRIENEEYKTCDLKTINDMHFVAIMKKIVASLSDNKTFNTGNVNSMTIYYCLEKFILFACTTMAMSLGEMISYVYPTSYYTTKLNRREETIVECCVLKTAEVNCTTNMPFNINMRDMALQDPTGDYSELKAALHYLMTNPRSLIHDELLKYGNTNDDVNVKGGAITDIVLRLCGTRNHMQYDKKGYIDTATMLDGIAYGNNYRDSNYRDDIDYGNDHTHPIRNTLDTIYKMLNPVEAENGYELVECINITNKVMLNIIDRVSAMNNNDDIRSYNPQIYKDVLATLGEIMTRCILKLFTKESQVFTIGSDMSTTLSPSTMYLESFIMEADDPQSIGGNKKPDDGPKVINKAANQNNQNGQSSPVKDIKAKIGKIIKAFVDWVTTKLAAFTTNFNKDHERELKYITNNTKTNEEILKGIQSGSLSNFTISNVSLFKIPAKELCNIKIKEVVDKYLNSKDPIDAKVIKKALYPGGDVIAAQIVDKPTPEEETAALTNYILYSQVTARPKYTGPVNTEIWQDLIENVTSTGRLLDSQVKAMTTELKNVCSELKAKIDKRDMQSPTANKDNTDNTDKTIGDRAEELFKIVQQVSASYYVTSLNLIRNKFYRESYKLYADIIKSYNDAVTAYKQSAAANKTTATNTANNTNINNTGNTNNGTDNNAGMPNTTEPK